MNSSLTDRVLARVDSYREAMRDFAGRLVALPTENPPGRGYPACVAAIREELRRLNLACQVVEVPAEAHGGAAPGRPDPEHPRQCLVAVAGGAGPTLYFHGHYDVVPAQRPAQFEPRVEGGRLVGRGASDMKGGLAAMIYAARVLHDLGLPAAGRVGLCIVPDEETGGAGGSEFLSSTGLLGRDGVGMLTAEPTGGVIWNASRGAVTLRVRVRGRTAHVGLQHQGVNAFERMLVVAGALGELKAEVERRETGYRITPAAARRSVLMLGGRVEGGVGASAVPGECWFTVDRRTNPEEDLAAEKARLTGVLERLRGAGIELDYEVLQEAPASGTPEDDRLARTLAAAAEAVTGRRPDFEMCPGLLETRFYARRGLPALGYGPGVLDVSHGPEEYVELDALPRSAAVYALTAAEFLGLPA